MFDNVPATMDQQLLRYAVEDPERCVPFMLDGMNKSHYDLFDPVKLAKGGEESKPIFVHITGSRSKKNRERQIKLLQKVLKLEDPQKEMLFGNTTWKEVIVPGRLY